MRVPVSWLRELVDLPAGITADALAERLTAVGLTVETIDRASAVRGPLVVGHVLSYDAETHKNGKPVRWCSVDTGDPQPRGIVCGADNFSAGDAVVVALPGATLPGGFAIAARKTYGHVSDGMICSARELGLGEDAAGIIVLEGGPTAGTDAAELLGLVDDVLDIAVTYDRGYALSMRGVGRETATVFDLPFRDPADVTIVPPTAQGHPVTVADSEACPVFVARTVRGIDAEGVSPQWLQRRIQRAGMRPISLVVDVTNYVMLELGQPIHAYDADALRGAIVVRRAAPGESLTTLDGRLRDLDPDDLLITDDSGPIGLAGVMGGAGTEVGATTRDVVIEAATFAPAVIGRGMRRHRLPSEASRRFERGVDPALAPAAAQRVVDLLVRLGGGSADPGATVVGRAPLSPVILAMPDLATRTLGSPLDASMVTTRLQQVGCLVALSGDALAVTPPTWRPDLRDPADLVEEVARLHGYARIPSLLPAAPAGRGWTPRQRARRRIGTALAEAGYVEAPCFPFISDADLDALLLPADDARRQVLRVANPMSEEQPYLRTTLLPGLLATLRRNVARDATDVGLFEEGLVFRRGADPLPPAPRIPVDRRPDGSQLAALEAALPAQPRRIAVVMCGARERAGWWGPARAVSWADAVQAAHTVAAAAGARLETRADDHAPWHPGRCAELLVAGRTVGHAGELHPRAVTALGLPPRTCAMELELDRMDVAAGPVQAPILSNFPAAGQDVALVLDADVPAAAVAAALADGGGALLESVELFDVYVGPQVGAGRRSLAYGLRFRAPDRTLTVEEATAARDAAVAEAHRRTGAVLRGG